METVVAVASSVPLEIGTVVEVRLYEVGPTDTTLGKIMKEISAEEYITIVSTECPSEERIRYSEEYAKYYNKLFPYHYLVSVD